MLDAGENDPVLHCGVEALVVESMLPLRPCQPGPTIACGSSWNRPASAIEGILLGTCADDQIDRNESARNVQCV